MTEKEKIFLLEGELKNIKSELKKYYDKKKKQKKKYNNYVRKYMKTKRNNRFNYYLDILRGKILGRYIEENKIFTKEDYEYIKSITI